MGVRELSMLAVAATAILCVGCNPYTSMPADLKPLQAEINDMKAQIAKLQSDAAAAQSTANHALSIGQSTETAIEATNEKIDHLFKNQVAR